MIVPYRSRLPVSKRLKSQLQPVFQYSAVAFPSRGIAPSHHCRNHSPQVLPSVQLSNMDISSRQRIHAPSNQTTNFRQLPETETVSATPSPGEINDRVDQVTLM